MPNDAPAVSPQSATDDIAQVQLVQTRMAGFADAIADYSVADTTGRAHQLGVPMAGMNDVRFDDGGLSFCTGDGPDQQHTLSPLECVGMAAFFARAARLMGVQS